MSRSGYWKSEPRTPSPHKALYPGICAVCQQDIRIGDPIAKKSGKYVTRYVHTTCAKEDDE